MRYILVSSRDPFQSREASHFYDLAASLASGGDEVTLYLVQNGTLAGRRGAQGDPLRGPVESGVEILADAFSLRERGIGEEDRNPAVRATDMEGFVKRMMEAPSKVLWQ